MSFAKFVEVYNFFWLVESQQQQRLAWEDAAEARIARARAEAHAAAQLRVILEANPSGMLGNAQLNDPDALKKSGLL